MSANSRNTLSWDSMRMTRDHKVTKERPSGRGAVRYPGERFSEYAIRGASDI